MTKKNIEEIVTLGYEEKKKREEGEREREELKKRRKEKEEVELLLRNLQGKSVVMINLNQAKLMNVENWIEIETTEMRNL